MERLVILGSLAALAAITWAFLGSVESPETARPATTSTPPSQRFVLSTGSATPVAEAASLDAGPVDAAVLTRAQVARSGLLGQDTRWIAPIMDQPSWRRISAGDSPTFKNTNGVLLKFIAPSGRVTQVTADFPGGAMSADLTALTEYLIGNGTHLPIHFEAYRRPDGAPKYGDFLGDDGRRYYYRGVLRQTGEAPYGPKEFAVSTHPFEGQPIQLSEHDDEHEKPRAPVPLDAGAP